MSFKKNLSEPKYMERSANALLVAKTNKVIGPIIAPVGYDNAGLAVGEALHAQATTHIRDKHLNTSEENEAYRAFSTKHKNLCVSYISHREITKVVFEDFPKIQEELYLDVPFSKDYPTQIDILDSFYSTLDNTDSYNEKTTPFLLDVDTIADIREQIKDVRLSRSTYTSSVGKTQDSTITKDESIKALKKWMDRFLSVARVVLVKHPQQMEALGIVVKR